MKFLTTASVLLVVATSSMTLASAAKGGEGKSVVSSGSSNVAVKAIAGAKAHKGSSSSSGGGGQKKGNGNKKKTSGGSGGDVAAATEGVDAYGHNALLESTYYPKNPVTGRGPWNKIVVIGDIHGDMDQAMILLKETGVITRQPDYYTKMILNKARMASASAYGYNAGAADDPSYSTAQLENKVGIGFAAKEAKAAKKADKKAKKGAAVAARKSDKELTDEQKANDGLGDFLPKDIAANMVYNKRGELMGGSTADEYHWAMGKALLVILGDCLNVGPDDIAAVTLVRRLTREADMAGGKLVYVLGNHEVMNLRGDFAGVHPWSFERTGGTEGRKRLLSTATEIGRFLRSRPGIFYYDNLMFMHGGLVPQAIRAVERAVEEEAGSGYDSAASPHLRGQVLADTINLHVREALFSHEDDPAAMDKDPIARTVVNVDYETNGKSGILLVHPLQLCDEVHLANNITGLEAQVVGHTPVDLPHYDYCQSALYALDMKNSKWKGGAGTLPAALILLREEKTYTAVAARAAGSAVAPPPNVTSNQTSASSASETKIHAASSSSSSSTGGQTWVEREEASEHKYGAKTADYRWSTRLIVPKAVVETAQQRVGGWTSISIGGFILWVVFLVALCELARVAYLRFSCDGKVPEGLKTRVDSASAFCDVIASYLPCSGNIYTRGMRMKQRSARRGGGGNSHGGVHHDGDQNEEDDENMYREVDSAGEGNRLVGMKSAPF